MDLCFQRFDEEVATLPGKYDTVLLAESARGLAGCAGLRPYGADVAELKRLFVYPWARGAGLGRGLTLAAIGEARRRGYRKLHLDTLQSKMPSAVALYRALGFREVPGPAGGNGNRDLVEMELDLSAGAADDRHAKQTGGAE